MRPTCTAALVLAFTLTALSVSAHGQDSPAAGARFTVSFAAGASSEPITGRVFVALSRDSTSEPRLQVSRYGVQFFGVDVEDLRPEQPVTIDATTLGYPIASLAGVPNSAYYVQAVLNKYTRFPRADGHVVWMHMDQWEGQNWRKSPGNLYSEVHQILFDARQDTVFRLRTTKTIPPVEPPADTRWVKHIKLRSKLLSDFWGHPIDIGAIVLLPRDYDQRPDTRYPTVYEHGHFSLNPPLRFDRDSTFTRLWRGENFPRFIAVTLQHPTPYFDDSYAVNSANNGPYGDAIHQELIPEIERRFRTIPASWARVLTGGSTGGWIAFALQVFHPDFYGGAWAFAPDPLDFRNVEGIDIYADSNAFYKEYEWYTVPIINTRNHRDGSVFLTSEQRNRMELVNGTKGRSGEQLDIWSAVFGPVGDDGYFKPLFDKRSGAIDPEVAAYWKEHYDLRHYLQQNWARIGPSLVGKLHVICGHMDNFYLNVGVYHMEAFLERTRDPYYAGTFTYGARGGHAWRPYNTAHLLRLMTDHITRNAPPGSDTQAWKY